MSRLGHPAGGGLDRRGLGVALRRWTIPTIGAVTPVGLIVVNIAAFIDHHLAEFRWTITVLAFVSGMMLNSWAALSIYRVAKRRMPGSVVVQEGNQELVLMAGMVVVIAAAFASALFCYIGLNDERDLPNKLTFVTGVLSILVPIVLQSLFQRALSGRNGASTSQPPLPPVGTPPGSLSPPPR